MAVRIEAFVEEIAREAVAKVAPDEMDAFDDLAGSAPEASADEDLAFGVASLVPLVTPIAIAVVSAVVTQAVSVVKEEGTAAFRQRVRAWFGTDQHPDRHTKARQAAYDQALAMGLEEPRARLLADAVLGALVAR